MVQPIDPLVSNQQGGVVTDQSTVPSDAYTSPDAVTSGFSDDQQGETYYPECTLDTRYGFHSGAAQLPVAGPDGTPAAIVKLSAGRWTRVVQFSFERLNDWPVVPHPDPSDSNQTLLYASIVPTRPQEGPNGLMVYRVSGRYVYALTNPFGDTGPFYSGAAPSSTRGPTANILAPVYFSKALSASVTA